MSDVLSAQHAPALRVGGRRLSTTARPKPHNAPGSSSPTAPRATAESADYPRPGGGAQGDGEADTGAPPPPHGEDEAPKKEKKQGHGHGGHDQNRLKESVYRKIETTMPSKGHSASKHAFGAAGRIGQPTGKALAV